MPQVFRINPVRNLRKKPLLGEPLEAVLAWNPKTLPAGCVCSQQSRSHKWLIVLETIHFTLQQGVSPQPLTV
jgi:hypothetical protein